MGARGGRKDLGACMTPTHLDLSLLPYRGRKHPSFGSQPPAARSFVTAAAGN